MSRRASSVGPKPWGLVRMSGFPKRPHLIITKPIRTSETGRVKQFLKKNQKNISQTKP